MMNWKNYCVEVNKGMISRGRKMLGQTVLEE